VQLTVLLPLTMRSDDDGCRDGSALQRALISSALCNTTLNLLLHVAPAVEQYCAGGPDQYLPGAALRWAVVVAWEASGLCLGAAIPSFGGVAAPCHRSGACPAHRKLSTNHLSADSLRYIVRPRGARAENICTGVACGIYLSWKNAGLQSRAD